MLVPFIVAVIGIIIILILALRIIGKYQDYIQEMEYDLKIDRFKIKELRHNIHEDLQKANEDKELIRVLSKNTLNANTEETVKWIDAFGKWFCLECMRLFDTTNICSCAKKKYYRAGSRQ